MADHSEQPEILSYYRIYTTSKQSDPYLKNFGIKRVKIGEKVCLWYENEILSEIKYYTHEGICYNIALKEGKKASIKRYNAKCVMQHVSGVIDRSFYQNARKKDIPVAVINQCSLGLKQSLSQLRSGTKFNLVYSGIYLPDGSIFNSQLNFLSINDRGKLSKIYHLKANGKSNFYDAAGGHVLQQKTVFQKPVSNRVKITSHFGMRFHPITKCHKYHRGVDYAAPYGSPVVAAASGVITKANFCGAYGRLIEIMHSGGYRTRYAHLATINVHVGSYVKQGMKIGSVGSSGNASGTHLHFELIEGKKAINPLRVVHLPQDHLKRKELMQFCHYKSKIDKYLNSI